MDLSELIKSSEKPYKVTLIATVNPHIFWLEPQLSGELTSKNYQIIQAGLACAFPTITEATEPIFQFQKRSCKEWTPAGSRLLQKTVREAGDVYFLPLQVMSDEFSLMENVTCIFGDLFIIENGALKSITGILSNYGCVYKSTSRFQRYLKSGQVFVDLTIPEIDEAIEKAITYANKKFASIVQNEPKLSNIEKQVDQYRAELVATLKDKDKEDKERILRDMDRVFKLVIEMDKLGPDYSTRVSKEDPIINKSILEDDGSNDSEATVTPKAQVRYMPAGANINNFTNTPVTSLKKKKKYDKKISSNKYGDTKVNVSNSSIDDANDPVLPNVSLFIKNASSNQPQKPRSFDTSSQTSSSYACSDLEDSLRSKCLQGEVNSSQGDNITKGGIGLHKPDTVSTSPNLKKHALARSLLHKNTLDMNTSDVPSQDMPNAVSTSPDLKKHALARSLLNKNTLDMNTSDVPSQDMPNAVSTSPNLKKHALARSLLNKNTLDMNTNDVPSQHMPNAVSTSPDLKKHALARSLLNKNTLEMNTSDVPSQHMPNAVSTSPDLKKHALARSLLNKNTLDMNTSDVPSQDMPNAVSTSPNLKKHALARSLLNKNTLDMNTSDVPSQDMPNAVSTSPNLKKHALARNLLNKNTLDMNTSDVPSQDMPNAVSSSPDLKKHALARIFLNKNSDSELKENSLKKSDNNNLELNTDVISDEPKSIICEDHNTTISDEGGEVSVTEKISMSSPESDPNLVLDESEVYNRESPSFHKSWSVSNILRFGLDASGIKSPFPLCGRLMSPVRSLVEIKPHTSSPVKNDASEICRTFSDHFAGGDLIDRITSPKIVIHNRTGATFSSVTNLDSAQFSPITVNNLKCSQVKIPSKLQSSVWPVGITDRSLFVVSSVRSGRGLSVLAPICDRLPKVFLSALPEGVGPIMMIVCPDMFAATKAFSTCKLLLKNCTTTMGSEFRILKIDDWNNSDITYSIVRGVDVLVITARCLYQFLNYEVSTINLERLLYLVFEDLDILNEQFHDETKRIMDMCQKHNHNKKLLVYATSQIWCEFIERLAKESHDPVVIVSSLKECLFYSKAEMNVTFCKADDKLQKLQDIFKKDGRMFRFKRVLIMCEGDEEISQVNDLLKEDFITYMADTTTIDVINDISNAWKSHDLRTSSAIMITYDQNLHFLGIDHVHWLIHFSLSKTFATFNFRFSSLAKNFHNLYDVTTNRLALKVDVVISDNDLMRLPKLVSYIGRFKMDIPEEFKHVVKDVIKLQDVDKANTSIPLCERLSAFGYCSNTWNCIERHSLVDSDQPSEWFPVLGSVMCHVISVQHASLFSARIIECVDLNGSRETFTQKHNLILSEIYTYFACEGNRQCHRFVKCGDICGVKVLNDYKRCQVMRIIPTSSAHSTDIIRVNLMDEECYIDVKRSDLMHLPNHWKVLCPTIVNVRLAGVIPSGDDDNSWSTTAIQHVRTLLNSEIDLFIQGNIVLGIGNTLWLDDIQVSQHLEAINIDIVKCNLKQDLICKNLAVENPNHLEVLYALCKTFNFDLPHYDKPIKKVPIKKSVEPQWAYLYDDLTKVYFSHAESVSLFYVTHEKFDKLLTNLEDDLQIYVQELKENPLKTDLNINDRKIQQGYYCVALFIDDGAYYRAKIIRALDAQGMPNVYECFFVDHGEQRTVRVEDIYPLTEDLLTKLPFQAIECRVFGVKPIVDNWQVEVDESDILLCKFYAKEKAEYTRGHKYAILLIDAIGTSLNDHIIEKKLALPVAEEFQMIEKDVDNIKQLIEVPCEDADKSNDDTSEILDVVEWSDEEVDDKWDCQFYNEDYQNMPMEDHIPKLCSLPEKPKLKKQDYHDIKRNILIGSNRNLVVYQTPRILWHQTKEHVTVKIMLPNVNIYECEIGLKSLYFETNIQPTRYKLDIELAGCVDQEKSYHVTKGMYVFIRIYKHDAMDWEKLIAPNVTTNSKLIVYDPDFLFVEEESESDEDREMFSGIVKDEIRRMNDDEMVDSDVEVCEDVKTFEMMDKDPINRKILRRMLNEQREENTDGSDECDE